VKRILRQSFNILVFIFLFFVVTKVDFQYKPNQVVSVYTTNYPLRFLIEELGGDSVRVNSIYEEFKAEKSVTVDEFGLQTEKVTYDYIPTTSYEFGMTQRLMDEIIKSDLYIYNGYSYETKYLGVLSNLEGIDLLDIRDVAYNIHKINPQPVEEEEIVVSMISNDLSLDYTIDVDKYLYGDIGLNPNVWQDPINLLQMAVDVRDILKEKLPTKTEIIDQNFNDYKGEILKYDSKLQKTIANGRNNLVIVDRPFLAHLKKYNLKQIPFSDMFYKNVINEDDFEDIYQIMKHYGINYVVTDGELQSEGFNKFVALYNIEVLYLHNLDVLPKDDYSNGETYFTIVNKDLKILEELLK